MSWGAIIGAGLSLLGSRKQSKTDVAIASANRDALKEAGTAKNVVDPMGQAQWNPITGTYELGLAPQQQGLFQDYLQDIYRQRSLAEPMMRDPEAAAQRRYSADLESLKLGEASAVQAGLRKGHARGLGVGSTLGVGALGEIDRVNLANRAASLSGARAGVQSDISNYLNRAEASRQGMFTIGQAPQSLGNIGQGLSADAVSAAKAGGASYLKAQQGASSAAAQPYYQLGGYFAGLNKKRNTTNDYADLEAQDAALAYWS